MDGLYYLDGLLDAEGGAILQTALNALSKPTSGTSAGEVWDRLMAGSYTGNMGVGYGRWSLWSTGGMSQGLPSLTQRRPYGRGQRVARFVSLQAD